MKLFKLSALVCLFFFMIACEEGAQRFVPIDEVDDGSSEITDDSDSTDPTTEPTNPTDPTTEPTNPTDEPTNPTDEPTNPTDEPTNPTDEPTNPTDEPTNPTDEPTNPTDEPTNPTDDPTNPLTNEEKCAAKNGTWESSSQRCYQEKACDPDKPANSEWNGDSSYKVYYDNNVEVLEPLTYPTQYGDGAPVPCQYTCIENYGPLNDQCKPLCSAKFNGTDAKIEIAANNAPTLTSEWTIEAWIKQSEAELPEYAIHPILRKGTSSNYSYLLSGYYKGKDGDGYGLSSHVHFSYTMGSRQYTSDNKVDAEFDAFSSDWTHVAMVHYNAGTQWQPNYKLLVFVNGVQIKSQSYTAYNQNVTPTVATNNEALVIGANLNTGNYFAGLIDSIKISSEAKYKENFTPEKLSTDSKTIAFWDFANDAKESVSGKFGTASGDLEYSADCE